MTKHNLRWHLDPGHGWLEVSRHECSTLNILDEISAYSYQHEGRVYLEEDRDVAIYFHARSLTPADVARLDIPTVDYTRDAQLRSYERFEYAP